MKLDIYQVDAFSQHPFGGNPAAVCPLTEWLPDEQLQNIAAENNLSETAYFVPVAISMSCAGSPRRSKWTCVAMPRWPQPGC